MMNNVAKRGVGFADVWLLECLRFFSLSCLCKQVFGIINTPTGQEVMPDPSLTLVHILKGREEVEDLVAVSEAHVPIVKFKWSGVEIDLLCACLQMASIPEKLDILDDSILRNVDEATQRSINGVRVTDAILRLVPNIENFRYVEQPQRGLHLPPGNVSPTLVITPLASLLFLHKSSWHPMCSL